MPVNSQVELYGNSYNSFTDGEILEYKLKYGFFNTSYASLSLDWCRPQRYYDQASWRGTWLSDGGVSTNQGIHYFDITRHLKDYTKRYMNNLMH